MTTTAPTHEQRASEFAAEVREHLADLPEAELDELLDGLHADLAERLEDGGDLGDAGQYADELRQAAGLPPQGERATKARKGMRESLREKRSDLIERSRIFWDATPGRQAIRDFALALRPVWWVLRGLVVAQLLLLLIGRGLGSDLDLFSGAVMILLVVLSVQWGRGFWASRGWARGLRTVAQVLAVALVLPVSMIALDAATRPNYVYVDDELSYDGLQANGERISNIFAYDCFGERIDSVQLFDQNGEPITTLPGPPGGPSPVPEWGFDEEQQQNIRYERNGLAGYAGTWNVFPLREARADMDRDPEATRARDAEWPTRSVLPLSPGCAAQLREDGAAEGATSGSAAGAASPGAQGEGASATGAESLTGSDAAAAADQ